jgi:nitroimidazol reductase NimA-like FMN-containing flavoprotein (pyridoxamine 5'-phosphate oxidase superfamily)
MRLTREEREAFLAEPHVASLAVAASADRGPLMMPIWYFYRPGGSLWISTEPQSRKAGLIAETGRFSLLVQRVRPTTRYVCVEGSVVSTRPTTDDEIRQLASRYLRPEKVEDYVVFARGEQRIELRPERWLSSDLGAP